MRPRSFVPVHGTLHHLTASAVEQVVLDGRKRLGPALTEGVRRAARRIVQEVSGVRAVVEVNVLRVE